jgi:hypothetical protein
MGQVRMGRRQVADSEVKPDNVRYVYVLYDGRAETQPYDDCSIYEICFSRRHAYARARAWDDAVIVRYVDPPKDEPITGDGERMYQLEWRP